MFARPWPGRLSTGERSPVDNLDTSADRADEAQRPAQHSPGHSGSGARSAAGVGVDGRDRGRIRCEGCRAVDQGVGALPEAEGEGLVVGEGMHGGLLG